MKIAVFSTLPPKKCGIAYLTQNLFSELRAQGHELTTFAVDAHSHGDYAVDNKSFFGLYKAAQEIKRRGIRHVSVQFIISFYGKKWMGLNFLLFLLALRKERVIVTLHELHSFRSFRQS